MCTRLLLATSLLLTDKQLWQSLWYEGRPRGTPLFIITSQAFHDAMNRLNRSWGHGGVDYKYRANCSLGDFELPVDIETYEK